MLATHTESHTSFWSRHADQARLKCSAAPALNLRAVRRLGETCMHWVELHCCF